MWSEITTSVSGRKFEGWHLGPPSWQELVDFGMLWGLGILGVVRSSWVVLRKSQGCSVTSCNVKGGKLRQHRVEEGVSHFEKITIMSVLCPGKETEVK